MQIKKIAAISFALLVLTACEPKPLSSSLLEAPTNVYGQLEKDSYLKGKITTGEFRCDAKHGLNLGGNYLAIRYKFTNEAVADSLRKAGYLSVSPDNATYILSGAIKDIGLPKCFFGNCDSGSAIEYTLTDIKKNTVAYHELLVVPYTMDYSIFLSNPQMELVFQQSAGGAVGNNIAHLLHVLNQKTKADLQGEK